MFDSTQIVISFLGIAHYLLISVSDCCGIKLEAEQDLGETSETRESQWLQVRKLLLSAEGFFAHTAHTPLDTPGDTIVFGMVHGHLILLVTPLLPVVSISLSTLTTELEGSERTSL